MLKSTTRIGGLQPLSTVFADYDFSGKPRTITEPNGEQTLLQYLRSYALSHTTNRIDVELGKRLFEHLLRLPEGDQLRLDRLRRVEVPPLHGGRRRDVARRRLPARTRARLGHSRHRGVGTTHRRTVPPRLGDPQSDRTRTDLTTR